MTTTLLRKTAWIVALLALAPLARAQTTQPATQPATKQVLSDEKRTSWADRGTILGRGPAWIPIPRIPEVKDWQARHEGFVEIAKQGNIDLLFVGDSITDLWRQKNGQAIWEQRYAPLKAANFGIGGDRTEHVLWRLQNGELDGINPKVVILMIGTNNVGRHSAPVIAKGVTAIVEYLRVKLPESKILLLAVFPRNEEPGTFYRGKIAGVNERIAKLDDGKMVRFLNINDQFLTPEGKLPREVMYDFLHPAAKGYQIWADAMQPTLDAMLAPR